jgi:hypothetical protein
LLVRVANSSAVNNPRIETAKAASFSSAGIVNTGVLKRLILSITNRPPKILPHAKRLRGLITAGLFSLMGERGKKRGVPIVTKKITRRL